MIPSIPSAFLLSSGNEREWLGEEMQGRHLGLGVRHVSFVDPIEVHQLQVSVQNVQAVTIKRVGGVPHPRGQNTQVMWRHDISGQVPGKHGGRKDLFASVQQVGEGLFLELSVQLVLGVPKVRHHHVHHASVDPEISIDEASKLSFR